MGLLHSADDEPDEAIAWLAFAHALDRGDHHSGAYAAELSAYDGRLRSARAILGEAQARVGDDERSDCE